MKRLRFLFILPLFPFYAQADTAPPAAVAGDLPVQEHKFFPLNAAPVNRTALQHMPRPDTIQAIRTASNPPSHPLPVPPLPAALPAAQAQGVLPTPPILDIFDPK